MNEIININTAMSETQAEAVKLHQSIMLNAEMAANSMVAMCRDLKTMRDRKLYEELGCSEFGEYTEKLVGIKARQAYTYISTYEKLGDTVLQSNATLGITKLSLIAQMNAEDRQELLASGEAEEKSVAEIKRLLEENKNQGEQISMLNETIDKLQEEVNTLSMPADEPSDDEKEEAYIERIQELEKQLAEAQNKQGPVSEEAQSLLRQEVTEEDIARVVSAWTGIPVTKMMTSEKQKYLQLEDVLHRRVVGQDVAVRAVSEAIRRNRAGLSDPNRPLGSFLFIGPTGVGKTELAKTLADFLFNDEKALTRIDMSEYMEKFSVTRLIGAPPGYVGYDEGGQLTEAVRRRPYSVVLFDEIEKAHPDVFNVLLQVLDDGRLTDGQGRVVDFKNTIIIMTSNLGSDLILEAASNDETDAVKEKVNALLKQTFRPEFLNRIDETVMFNRLGKEHIKAIASLQLKRVGARLEDRRISLVTEDSALDFIAEEGYNPSFGARPVKRAIQTYVENPLAGMLLAGKIPDGSVVRASWDGKSYDENALTYSVEHPVKSA
ncbi:MAG TPA: hypothetical protein DCZ74_05270 [Treponema sp.]|nr:hypothetical protein [Treponema sp.]